MTRRFGGLKSSLAKGLIATCLLFSQEVFAADKVALVIGNAAYVNGSDLKTPIADTAAIAGALKAQGYDTVLIQNVTNAEFLRSLAELRIRAQDAEQVVIYFAGHGVQKAGQSFVMNVDAEFSGSQTKRSLMPLRVLVRSISDRARQKIIFIDACRDNPAYHDKGVQARSVADDPAPAGLFVLYASRPGGPAHDGTGKHSPFAQAFLAAHQQNVELEDLARRIRIDVIRATQGSQVPWSQSSLLRPAFLH